VRRDVGLKVGAIGLAVAVIALVAIIITARATTSAPARPPVVAHPARVPGKQADESTIAARDYIGPVACGDCHPDEHARWSTSLHRVMNQRAETTGAVIGDWTGAAVAYAGGEARFDHDRTGYTMTLAKGGQTVRYRVTRTIGRRGLQEYVGVEDGHTEEVRLPFGWWPRRGGWYPQPYFDPWFRAESEFDAYAPVREPWAERCVWCHSTYPFEQRIARASGPRLVGHGLEQYFTSAPGGDRLDVTQQVTAGISCESCHLGGRAHAAGAPIHFVPAGATPRAGAPARTTFQAERRDAAIVGAVCAQCHSGPSPRLPDQTALRNSSESLDLAASPCTGIKCTDCHDPHRADGRGDDARAVAACTGCHTGFADPARAKRHGGHDATSCLDCHMPRMVMGIDRFVRTHRISSPTDRTMLAAAAPNACNLCHLDRSIQWTVEELRSGYEVRLDPRAWTAYGEPDAPVGDVWLASKEPALRLIATAAYARSPLGKFALPSIMRGLADALPHVRVWTLFAVEDILGRKLSVAAYDPRGTTEQRARQLKRLSP
jgi:hypothetical protein